MSPHDFYHLLGTIGSTKNKLLKSIDKGNNPRTDLCAQTHCHQYGVLNVEFGIWKIESESSKKKMNHSIFRTQSFVSTEHSNIFIRNDRLLNDLSCICWRFSFGTFIRIRVSVARAHTLFFIIFN